MPVPKLKDIPIKNITRGSLISTGKNMTRGGLISTGTSSWPFGASSWPSWASPWPSDVWPI